MKTCLLLLLWLAIATQSAYCQSPTLDSLRQVIETADSDTLKGRSLCRLCNRLLKAIGIEQALDAGNKGLAVAIQARDHRGQAICFNSLGVVYYTQGDLETALEYYKKSIASRNKINDHEENDKLSQARVILNVAIIYARMGAIDESREYFEQSLQINRDLKNEDGISQCYTNLGILSQQEGKYDEARVHFQSSLRLMQKLGNVAAAASTLSNIGHVYRAQGYYVKALESYQQGLRANQTLENLRGIAHSLESIASLYFDQKLYDKSKDYYQKSLQAHEKAEDRPGIANNLSNLANLYAVQGKLEQALEHYQKSLQLHRETGNPLSLAHTLSNIGNLYGDLKDYPKALEYHLQGLEIVEKTGDQAGISNSYINLSFAYVALNQAQKAQFYAQKGFGLAEEIDNQLQKMKGAQACYRADSALGNWKTAFEFARLFHQFADSMKNDEQSLELGRLDAQHQYNKQAGIEKVKNEEERAQTALRTNWIVGSTLVGLFLTFLIAFTLFRSRRKEKHANDFLRQLNQEIQCQKVEIETQNSEIISQRDQLEHTNQRLIALDRAKEELAGMIVHDLKNPLNAVLGMAALPPDKRRLHLILAAGQQMSQLVLNFLDIQKSETTAIQINPKPLAAAQLIQDVLQQTAHLAEQKQVSFDLRCESNVSVLADKELLTRVWTNLLTNAIKYAPLGDTILIEIKFEPIGNTAHFSLTDHGQGIPQDQLKAVFERYVQVGGGQSSGHLKSTGLGLTFCRLAIEAHNGSIEVQSDLGEYTTIAFTLPNASVSTLPSTETKLLHTQTKPILSPETTQAYQTVFAGLKILPAYELTTIYDYLDLLPDLPESLGIWKEQLELAALAGNEQRFQELLECTTLPQNQV